MIKEKTEEKVGFDVGNIVVYVKTEQPAKILKRYDLKQNGKEFRVYRIKIIDMKGPKATKMVHEKDLDIL